MTKSKRSTSDKLSIAGIVLLASAPIVYISIAAYSQQVIYSLVNSRSITLAETDIDAKLSGAESLVNVAIKLTLVMIAVGISLLALSLAKKRAGK